MGNQSAKQSSSANRPKKNVHWKSAETASPPGKPVLVHIDDTEPDVVNLRWERPRTDGGSPLYGYYVEHRRTGSPLWVRSTPALILYPEVVLNGLEPGWRYQFRVTAENAVGSSEYSEISEPLTVSLHRNAASAPQFVNELPDTTVIENEKVEFHVALTGAPTPQVNWFKDGFEVFSSRRTKILNDTNSSTLIIHQTALTDEGEIKCTATNRIGHVATKAMLRIEAPPKIRLPRQYEDGLLIEADDVIRLKVGLAGRPNPQVVWCHNGEEIQNGDRYELETTDKNSTLKITNSKRSDRGEYHLRAVNQLGVDSVSFLVTVTDRPSKPGKVNVTMSIGKSVTLSWTTPDDDGGCKIGNFVVEYFRLGWNVWLKAVTTRQLTATLNDLIEGSEYKFRVKAESPYGMSDPSEESDVMFVPDPKRGITKPDSIELTTNDYEQKRSPRPNTKSTHSSEITRTLSETKSQPSTKKANLDTPSNRNQRVPSPKLYDSETIAREMSYGTTSDLVQKQKLKRDLNFDDDNLTRETNYDRTEQTYNPRSKIMKNYEVTPNPPKESSTKKTTTNGRQQLDDQKQQQRQEIEKINDRKMDSLAAHRGNSDEVHTSNEFVLVIYDKDEQRQPPKPKDTTSPDPEFDSILPPTLSQSTPELTLEAPVAPGMRRCVSSTEMLYEKAMQRFYKAVEFEETENSRRSASVEARHVPHELPSSLRRLGSFGEADAIAHRNSLRKKILPESLTIAPKPPEANEAKKPEKIKQKIDEDTVSIISDDHRDIKREIMESQKKSTLNRRGSLTPTSSVEYEEDYTDSTASTGGSMSSVDSMEKFKNVIRSIAKENPDELDTYNPMMSSRTVASSNVRTIEDSAFEASRKALPVPEVIEHVKPESHFEDFSEKNLVSDEPEVLISEEEIEHHKDEQPAKEPKSTEQPRDESARALSPYRTPDPDQSSIALTRPFQPDPDFVPKPILKRSSIDETQNDKKDKKTKDDKADKPEKSKGGILSIFKKSTSSSNEDKKDAPTTTPVEKEEKKMSASALAKKKSMERRQSSLEENKVAIDHYSDIVNTVSVHRTPKVPIYLSADELKKVAAREASAKRLTKQSSNASNASTTSSTTSNNPQTPKRLSASPVPVPRPKELDTRSIFAIKLSKDPKKMAAEAKPPIDFSRNVEVNAEPPPLPSTQTVAPKSNTLPREESKNRSRENSMDSTSKKRAPSATRSRSGSAVRKTSTTREPSQSRPSVSREPSQSHPSASREPSQNRPSVSREPSQNRPSVSREPSQNRPSVSREPSQTSRPNRDRSTTRHISATSRAPSNSRTKTPSKSPSGRNRTLHVARIGIRDAAERSVHSPEPRSQTPEQLLDEAEKTVKSTMAYVMDVSMLIVASWVYAFKDARLVLPILLLLIYRQLSSALKGKMPNWMKRKRSGADEEMKE